MSRAKFRVRLVKQSATLFEWYEYRSDGTRELVNRIYAALLIQGVWRLQASDPQRKPIAKMGTFDSLEKLCALLGVPIPENAPLDPVPDQPSYEEF